MEARLGGMSLDFGLFLAVHTLMIRIRISMPDLSFGTDMVAKVLEPFCEGWPQEEGGTSSRNDPFGEDASKRWRNPAGWE